MATLVNDANQLLYSSISRVIGAAVSISTGTVTNLVVPKSSTVTVPSSIPLQANVLGYVIPSFTWSYRFGDTGSFISIVGLTNTVSFNCDAAFLTAAGASTLVQFKVAVAETTLGLGINQSEGIVSLPILREGTNGVAGIRGSRQLYDSSSIYSAAYEYLTNAAGADSYAAKATAVIAAATTGSTPTTPIKGDTLTFSNNTAGSEYVYTITHDGTAWVTPGTIIDGALLVTGTVTAAKINSNGLSIRDAAGNTILSAGNSLATSSLNLPGNINNVPAEWQNSNTETKLGRNQWLILRYDAPIAINSIGTLPTYAVINKASLAASALLPNTTTNFTWNLDQYIGVAGCTIYSETAWSWTLTVAHDDFGSIYINGTKVYEGIIGSRDTTLSIPAGWSTIELMWAEQGGGDLFSISQAISERAEVKQMWGRLDYSRQAAAAAAVADTKLSKTAADTLSSTISVNAVTGAGFRAGSLTWDASGIVTGGSGVAMTPGGLVGVDSSGNTTFVISAATGSSVFRGSITGASGNFSGTLNGANITGATGTFGGTLTAGTVDPSQLVGTTYRYTSPGTYYPTVPVGYTQMRVTLVGGGGGGAYGLSGSRGGGGGGGGLTVATFPVTPGDTMTVIVGSGGAGRAGHPNSMGGGSSGSNTTVVNYATAGGGGGGSATTTAGGAGGFGTISGSSGGGVLYGYDSYGDGRYYYLGGSGGSSGAGYGSGGSGGGESNGAYSYVNATSGTQYGGGGGGLASAHNNAPAGSGAGGLAIIEFFNPNGVIIRSEWNALIAALQRQNIQTT